MAKKSAAGRDGGPVIRLIKGRTPLMLATFNLV